MSLLSYASPWTSDPSSKNAADSAAPSRKRIPTMSNPRKTAKVRPNAGSISDEYDVYDTEELTSIRTNSKPNTIEDTVLKQTDTNTRVNSILNKITSFSNDERLGDFNPMPYPTTINRKTTDNIVPADEPLEPNGLNPLLPNSLFPAIERGDTKSSYIRPSNAAGTYANYRDAYGREPMTASGKEPYYSKMGISQSGGGDKMMDRLNYMTQMLESLQMERTDHITEEFVLYTLLGVFMIYIVDGFSRGGKYVR